MCKHSGYFLLKILHHTSSLSHRKLRRLFGIVDSIKTFRLPCKHLSQLLEKLCPARVAFCDTPTYYIQFLNPHLFLSETSFDARLLAFGHLQCPLQRTKQAFLLRYNEKGFYNFYSCIVYVSRAVHVCIYTKFGSL